MPRDLRELLVDAVREFVERGGRVAAARHHRGAGVVLLAAEHEADAAQADDARDDPDPASRVFEVRALFDVRFDEAGIAIGIQAQPRHARKAGLAQGVRQRGAATVGRAVLHLAASARR